MSDGSVRQLKLPMTIAQSTKDSARSFMMEKVFCCAMLSRILVRRSSAVRSGRNTKSGRSIPSSSTTWDRSRITCTRISSRRNSLDVKESLRRTTSRRSTTMWEIIFPIRLWVSNQARPEIRSAAVSRIGARATTRSHHSVVHISWKLAQVG